MRMDETMSPVRCRLIFGLLQVLLPAGAGDEAAGFEASEASFCAAWETVRPFSEANDGSREPRMAGTRGTNVSDMVEGVTI